MKLTATTAAKELGIDPKTLVVRLRKEGIEIRKGAKYSLRVIVGAVYGDLYKERTRRERAEAELSEQEAARNRGDLIRREDVSRFIRESFVPVREQVVAMPSTMAAKVNPSDPQHAKAHLEAWRDMFLRVCKEVRP